MTMNTATEVLQSNQPHVNGERLWQSLMELAQLGATVKGGVCRLALTDLDRQARDLFVRWCEEAGCTVTVDGVGNMGAHCSLAISPTGQPAISFLTYRLEFAQFNGSTWTLSTVDSTGDVGQDSSIAIGIVSTQAIRMFLIVPPCRPLRLATIVPATPDDSTWVVETGRPNRLAKPIAQLAVIWAHAPWA